MTDGQPTTCDEPTVQIVEDESKIAELYRLHLPDECEVRIETTGQAALEAMDGAVDVLVVDRRMPGISGDELVEKVRERGYDCAIAMVSAVDPDLETVDTAFDAYLVKPLSGERLRQTVEELSTIRECDDAVRDQYALLQQLTTLKTTSSRRNIEDSDTYADLIDQLRRCREEATTRVERLVDSTFEPVLDDLADEQPQST